MFRNWIVFACLLAAAIGASASQTHGPWTVENVLSELDSHAHDFKSLTADIERTKVTVVANDRSTETGTIAVEGDKMRLDLKQPDVRTILRNGDNFYIYTPGLKRLEEYNLGKRRGLVEQFLQLGFGSSGQELQRGYQVAIAGEPMVDNRKTVELELIPRSAELKNQFSKIDLWLDPSTWLPMQQEFFEAGTRDYFIIHYTDIVRNAHVNEAVFKPHWPKGTQRIKPQG